MDFEQQYAQMIQNQLREMLQDYIDGSSKQDAAKNDFNDIPKAYEVHITFPLDQFEDEFD